MKPGYRTTEFYAAAASIIITALVLLQVLPAGEHEDLAKALAEALGATAAAVTNALIVIRYIQSRTTLKQVEATKGAA
jgi:hypothetical protein